MHYITKVMPLNLKIIHLVQRKAGLLSFSESKDFIRVSVIFYEKFVNRNRCQFLCPCRENTLTL